VAEVLYATLVMRPPDRYSRLDFKTIVTFGAPNSYETPNIGIAADDRYCFNEPTHRPSRATRMNAHDALSRRW